MRLSAKMLGCPIMFIVLIHAACSGTGSSGGDLPPCSTDADCSEPGQICMDNACQLDPDFSGGLSDEELAELDNIDGLGAGDEPSTIGSVIDTFCGIDAYQNGPNISATHGSSPYGWKHQCTEYAYRFTCQHYAMCEKKVGKYGNAKAWWTNFSDPVFKQLERHPNNGTEPPRPGDILVFDGKQYGHVAIIKSVDEGSVHVIEQNVYKGSHSYLMTNSGGSYTIKKALGWMRVPNSAPACGNGTADNPAAAYISSPSDGQSVSGSFLVTGNATDGDGLQKVSVTIGTNVGFVACDGNCGGNMASFSNSIDPSQYGINSGSQVSIAVWAKDLLGNVKGPLATKSIFWSSNSVPTCGDNVCGSGESSSNCCLDCGCPNGQACQGNTCTTAEFCGNNICGPGENSGNCCMDCGCAAGQQCQNNTCVAQCPAGNYGQFSISNYIYPNFGPVGCSGDNTTKLKASAAMISPTMLRIYVRKDDNSNFTAGATLHLFVGVGPTCPDPPNVIKTSIVTVATQEQMIDISVNPYGAAWNLGETKTFWVGRDEGNHLAWRASGTISVTRNCIP